MKQKRMMAIAVGCGLACAACVAVFMASVQGQAESARAEALARYGGEQVEVCVATRDISAGERLDLSSVEVKLWVADLLPEDALRTSGDAVGKVATSSILKGEVISSKRFENVRDSLDVPAGKEAVSVPAKAVQAVGGAIRPGMAVDVYAAGDTATTLIAQSVQVLATSVGESGSLVSSGAGWVTLAVAPERVQEIIAASSKANLYFVIPGDQVEPASYEEVVELYDIPSTSAADDSDANELSRDSSSESSDAAYVGDDAREGSERRREGGEDR